MKKLVVFLFLSSGYAYGQVINKPQHDIPIIINDYTEVLALDVCKNEITVADPTAYKIDDTVLIIQMKGAIIDTSNTSAYGTIMDYKNAGNYEMNYISTVTGNKIVFRNALTRQYDVPDGAVQLVRVPFIKVTNYIGEYTCMTWDGTKGGVLVLNAQTINLKDDIEISARGFKGGEVAASTSSQCFENGINYPAGSMAAAYKGNSIATVSQNQSKGKGTPANGGGGGLANKSGGGGGGNGGTGGFGGYQSDTCANAPFDNRGIGGRSLTYSTALNKVFMGGGGGAGYARNVSSVSFGEGSGGGIAIIIADNLISNSNKIISDGWSGQFCSIADCNEGMGGAGAGGTILLYVNNIIDNAEIECIGGSGANVTGPISPGGRVGPGGGGGGGMFFLNRSSLPGNVNANVSGGSNGYITTNSNNAWGATSGTDGVTLFDLPNPYNNVLFKKNIDSVRFNENLNGCNTFDFTGTAYTNTAAVNSWQWFFGDGGTANMQNTSHTYASPGTYTVKLIGTDPNGCKDSISKSLIVTLNIDSVRFTNSLTGCNTYNFTGTAYINTTAINSWQWFFGDGGTANTQNTSHTYAVAGTYPVKLIATDFNGCKDSITKNVMLPGITAEAGNNQSFCSDGIISTTLNSSGSIGSNYSWSPTAYLNNSNLQNPVAIIDTTTTFYLTVTNSTGCMATDSVKIIINTVTVVTATKSNDINCLTPTSQLNATGGLQYSWLPAINLNNPFIANPVAKPNTTTTYIVTGTGTGGCDGTATVIVKADRTGEIELPNAFTPNGDTINDCFGIKYPLSVSNLKFIIYNYLGQIVFVTSKPATCWDGTYKGEKANMGNYVYYLTAITNCGPVELKGNVLLIR